MIKLNRLQLNAGEGMTIAQKEQLSSNTADIESVKENQVTVNDIKAIMESLPDGSAVSSQVALNTTQLSTNTKQIETNTANIAQNARNLSDIEEEVDDIETEIEDTISGDNGVPDYDSLPLLCGQPMMLFGAGTPQEAIVPDGWKQFLDGGYNWNGLPSAVGQVYINTAVTSNGRYTAYKKSDGTLAWLNF